MLAYIVAGLVSGSVYGLAGVGLVLTYKTSGIFNFAHGALATLAAYAFYFLYVQHNVPWPLAAGIVLILLAPLVGTGLARFGKTLAQASLPLQVTGTVGILLIIESVFTIIYGNVQDRSIPAFLPTGVVGILGVRVAWEFIIIVAVTVVATFGLYLFLRVSRLGMAMRAVVDDAPLLDLSGTKPDRVRKWAWVIGVGFAMMSGLLLAPLVPLDQTTLTFLVVQAFGAAAIGAFTSLPITFLAGIGIGIAGAVATEYFQSGVLGQLPASFPFILLFLALLVMPRKWLHSRVPARPSARTDWTAPVRAQLVLGAVVIVSLGFVPYLVGYHLQDWTLGLTTVMVFLSLGLLIRTSGQISLGQVTFTAIGAAAFSHLAVDHHWPWLLALLLAGLIAVPVGAVLAIPATRLGGIYLALATLAFGIAVSQLFYTSGWMFGQLGLGLTMPQPDIRWLALNSPNGFYYLCLFFTVLTAVAVIAVNRSRLGRLLRGIGDSPLALSTNGASVTVSRVLVFCISAFIAAVAGALGGMVNGVVTGDNYQPIVSLTYVAVIILVVGGAPWYALVAGFGLSVLPSYITSPNTNNYLMLIFGLSAVALGLAPNHRDVPQRIRGALDSWFRGRDRFDAHGPSPLPEIAVASRGETSRVEPMRLKADGIRVEFGGLVAVDSFSIEVVSGEIVGLIGPNGAGKTTIFNSCSGLIRPKRGLVYIDEQNVSRRGPALRARRGLGRTFQQAQLFESMSVRENVTLGAEARHAGANPWRHVLPRRTEVGKVIRAAENAMEICDLDELRDAGVNDLPSGQRRLVELARCIAGGYRILLLDEPSAGLDRTERLKFSQIVRNVVREYGLGVFIIEHDMTLMNDLCDEIFVLDFGRLIFSGTPQEVSSSEVVQAAYLGRGAGVDVALAADSDGEEL